MVASEKKRSELSLLMEVQWFWDDLKDGLMGWRHRSRIQRDETPDNALVELLVEDQMDQQDGQHPS
jgi:hypothetical protein